MTGRKITITKQEEITFFIPDELTTNQEEAEDLAIDFAMLSDLQFLGYSITASENTTDENLHRTIIKLKQEDLDNL